MREEPSIDTSADEERAESDRYRAKLGPAGIIAETWRLSIEYYGMPAGDMRDGHSCTYVRNPDGTKT